MRYLIIANETATSPALLDKVRECAEAGDSTFHLLVPAKHPTGAWSEGQVNAAASIRLEEGLGALKAIGVDATGEVGDTSPVRAVGDVILGRAVDAILLSTLPTGPSRWLHQDVPNRLMKRYSIPLTHIVSEPAPVR